MEFGTEQKVFVTNTSKKVRSMGGRLMMPGVKQQVPFEFVALFGHDQLVYDFSAVQERLQTRNELGQPIVDWRSPLSAIDGYGIHAVWILKALQAAGVEARVHDVGWVDNVFLAPDIKQMVHHANTMLPARTGVTFTLGYDPHLYRTSSLMKIGITQFETDTLPKKHVENVNQLDHCMVTSSFLVKVFKDSGVIVPITLMPPGVPGDEFPYKGDRRMDGLFKVLLFGALSPRKNPLGAIRIFQEASKGNPDWRFTIKARVGSPGIDEVIALAAPDPRITVISSDTSPESILQLYYDHHCLLWPSCGEGTGLPPMEAMATGMEVVVSDNSGMSDYVDADWCYPIKTKGKESAHGPNLFTDDYVKYHGTVGQWWRPDEKHGAKQLEKCFNNWLDGKGKGARAAAVMRERYTMAQSVAPLVEVIEGYSQ